MNESELTQHISRQFNEELEDARNRVLAMGGFVEQQLADAIDALMNADRAKGEGVVRSDTRVNRFDVEIDELCTRILARRQPAASDLRLVMTIVRTTTDLERIGDEVKRIGRLAAELSEMQGRPLHFPQLEHLTARVQKILHDALDCFARMDVDVAVEVERQDRKVDADYESIMREAITYMMEDPRSIPLMLRITWTARALERVGDRSCNISEYVIYLVRGKDVRHISLDDLEQTVRAER